MPTQKLERKNSPVLEANVCVPHYLEQQRALHTTVFKSSLGAKGIADAVGMSYSAVCKACDEDEPFSWPFARVALLVRASDNHALLDNWEKHAGRVAVQLPQIEGLTRPNLLLAELHVLETMAEKARAMREARERGLITHNEAVIISDRIHAVQRSLVELEHAVHTEASVGNLRRTTDPAPTLQPRRVIVEPELKVRA